MSDVGPFLRVVREAAGLTLGQMSKRAHFTKSYLSLVELGRRPATSDVVMAYERVLGVGGLGEAVDRRGFLSVAGLVAANARGVGELTACIAGGDVVPLTTVQTTYGVDRAIASVVDRGTLKFLRRWAEEEGNPVARVNAAGILAKLPGQCEADLVVGILGRDEEVRNRHLAAVVARVCSLDWASAVSAAFDPASLPYPVLAAERFCKEAVTPADAGARWCSATMLQRLSPLLGR